MKKINIYRLTISFILPIGLIIALFSNSKKPFPNTPELISEVETEKQKGAHVFGIVDTTDFQSLIDNNIEWITLVTWGFLDEYNSPIVTHHDGDSISIRKSDSSWVQRIKMVRAAGFKIFIKPHVWIMNSDDGKWRSDVFPNSEEDWKLWQNSYRDYILRYARIAEQAKAEMFCVGVEFSRLSVEKPEFWKEIIREVRGTFSGKLTYAANWYNEFEEITFWGDLDFIGVQAYFPLVKNDYPSKQQLSKGWKKYLSTLEATHLTFDRHILFTEMGYKSTSNSGVRPWEWLENTFDQARRISVETQANCYEAFFDTVWKQKWFAGVHIWQLRTDYTEDLGYFNLDFTPQGKAAEKIIAKGFE